MNSEIPKNLTDSDPDDFTIKRKKWGRGYRYYNGTGKELKDEQKLAIVKDIPVPDTWTEVTLSDRDNAYILARGYDGSGKLQYLYHPDYLEFRNEKKFARLVEFGLSLPRIRRKLRDDLKNESWSERKLLALVVKILDKYHLRIGSRAYARANNSFGLTTLRKKHVKETDDAFEIKYKGKSGQERTIDLNDPELVKLVEELSEFQGWELFSFRKGHQKININADAVNEYIREISNSEFTARDFRTWAGTALSIQYLPRAIGIVDENPNRKVVSALVELVAEKLGNTPGVCKEYYIHPEVLQEVVKEGFECEPCHEKFVKNTLYRNCERRTLEILTNIVNEAPDE